MISFSHFFFSFRPLQFSFLGQIYKTKSSSGMSSSSSSKKQRRCASQKVTTSTSSSRNHVLESSNEDFTLNSDSAKNLSTQVILENWLYSASKNCQNILICFENKIEKNNASSSVLSVIFQKVALNVFCISSLFLIYGVLILITKIWLNTWILTLKICRWI